MGSRFVIPALATGLALLLASQVHALTLTNREVAEQRVIIVEGSGEPKAREIILSPDQILKSLCKDGCTIALDNGVEQSFEGHENVFIQEGGFIIAE